MQRKQRTFLESLRAHREYTNPDFLQQLVRNYNLQEAGTAFPPDVFDPTLLPPDDFAGETQSDNHSVCISYRYSQYAPSGMVTPNTCIPWSFCAATLCHPPVQMSWHAQLIGRLRGGGRHVRPPHQGRPRYPLSGALGRWACCRHHTARAIWQLLGRHRQQGQGCCST
jgi:hypothetical protein